MLYAEWPASRGRSLNVQTRPGSGWNGIWAEPSPAGALRRAGTNGVSRATRRSGHAVLLHDRSALLVLLGLVDELGIEKILQLGQLILQRPGRRGGSRGRGAGGIGLLPHLAH